MRHTTIILLSCILGITSNLNAQEKEVEIPITTQESKSLNSPSDIVNAPETGPTEDTGQADDSPVQVTPTEDVPSAQEVEMTDEGDVQIDEAEEGTIEPTDSNDIGEIEDGDAEDEDEDEDFGPIVVSVNERGELVGAVSVIVGGEVVPVEANVTIVQNGIPVSALVSDEEGSFSFPNISPGDYNMYGTASSFCGQREVTVIPGNACCDTVGLRLDQYSTCYRGATSAPAARFAGPVASGPVGGGGLGGGFAGGGGGGFISGAAGGLAGRGGLRLLGIGGIATAIAVGGNGDASPTE